ncbi:MULTISPECIES: DUF4387 domain-containing protein [unclassified Variovorax]|uniref:DUF4387 domain-containing protein n=1 Tax=unclassified Variovorax TaxID=663243 RepID=UPI001BD2333F|nr:MULTISPECIES: DUF4387 domain-containing protein [unclassified Variovorax]
MTQLKDLAQVIRSKNSGPFEITFDVMFKDASTYQFVEQSGVLTHDLMCRLYGVKREDIVALLFFKPAQAFKFTLRRNWAQGSINERDTFGAQQHAPLMTIDIPTEPR